MRLLILLTTFFLLTISCSKDKNNPTTQITKVAGKWVLIETEEMVNGQKVWVKIDSKNSYTLEMTPTGVLLNEDGYRPCCSPNKITLNGIKYIVPISGYEADPSCILVSCAPPLQ